MLTRHLFATAVIASLLASHACAQSLGLFTDQRDIGVILHPGSGQFDPSSGVYTLTASGVNMWFTNDAFHYVYKQMSGDVRFTADIRFPKPGGNAHRKACLVLRQDLEPGSVYADAVSHGNGLTALQCRPGPNSNTTEIIETDDAQATLCIEKRGAFMTLSMARPGEALHPAGGEYALTLHDPFYIGLGLSAHDANAVETAEFSNVKIEALPPVSGPPVCGGSAVEIIPVSGDRRALCVMADPVESLSWSTDAKNVFFTSGGLRVQVSAAGGTPVAVKDSGFVSNLSNLISPNGVWVVANEFHDGIGSLRVTPTAGGAIRTLARYFGDKPAPIAWSPDSKQIAIVSCQPVYH